MNRPKILYVDDEYINLELLEINLAGNFNVLKAESGLIGLEILNIHDDIRVVISDMKMPVMNGLEFIRKAGEKHPSIKFYIFTGYDITEEMLTAMKDGLILKCFRKPFNMKEIEQEIRRVL